MKPTLAQLNGTTRARCGSSSGVSSCGMAACFLAAAAPWLDFGRFAIYTRAVRVFRRRECEWCHGVRTAAQSAIQTQLCESSKPRAPALLAFMLQQQRRTAR